MELDSESIHGAGIQHQTGDELSRIPTNGSDRTFLKGDIPDMIATWSNKQELIFAMTDTADCFHDEITSTFENGQAALLEFINTQRADTYWKQIRKL